MLKRGGRVWARVWGGEVAVVGVLGMAVEGEAVRGEVMGGESIDEGRRRESSPSMGRGSSVSAAAASAASFSSFSFFSLASRRRRTQPMPVGKRRGDEKRR